ncbi:LicD family protein [Glaciecola sp.]|jgi:hypothetical protein|uniref:LicD family protein n=1 Tax=Glaciecola sp. MF2-115 TaxID=3384827 RepID=UPI00398A1A47
MQYRLNKRYSDYASVHEISKLALSISDKYEIEALMIGGSLLGLVRDGDLLPWDKDVDFAVFEKDIDKTFALEGEFRAAGFECRLHYLGVRSPESLQKGKALLLELQQRLNELGIENCQLNGGLLNLYRDGELFSESQALSMLLNTNNIDTMRDVKARISDLGDTYLNVDGDFTKGVILIAGEWRINLFCYHQNPDDQSEFGWSDLNCDHWFSSPLFPAQTKEVHGMTLNLPNDFEGHLLARFGKNWHKPSPSQFSNGRVEGWMQLYKDGVMVDYIVHYVRGEKTYWFEPAANVISTKGFLPATLEDTPAGKLLMPDHPEIFLTEHYGDWKTPVKSWNGAVDNPTIVPSDEAMQAIINPKS